MAKQLQHLGDTHTEHTILLCHRCVVLEGGSPRFLAQGVHREANGRTGQDRGAIFQEGVFLHGAFNKIMGKTNNTIGDVPTSERGDSRLEVTSEEIFLGHCGHVEPEGVEKIGFESQNFTFGISVV